MCELMRMTLARQGYDVSTAGDGISGYELAVETQPDLLITDIHMPAADGAHLVRRVRDTREISSITNPRHHRIRHGKSHIYARSGRGCVRTQANRSGELAYDRAAASERASGQVAFLFLESRETKKSRR